MRSRPRRFWQPRLLYPAWAKRLSVAEFICVNELVLLLCVPFMLRTQRSREHFFALISSVSNLGKFGALLLIGLIGIVLYAFGLGRGQRSSFVGDCACGRHGRV